MAGRAALPRHAGPPRRARTLGVAALRLDARGAWELDLSTGVTVRLGRRQVDERMDRFVQFGAQVIAGQAADIRYVDMRYSNGFSIGWRGDRKPRDAAPRTSPANRMETRIRWLNVPTAT